MSRKAVDNIIYGITYLFSSAGILTLLAILIFVFSNGFKLLNIDLLVSDYYSYVYDTRSPSSPMLYNFENPNIEGTSFSSTWGVALKDGVNKENRPIVQVMYVDERSPLNNMEYKDQEGYVKIAIGHQIDRIFGKTSEGKLIAMLSKTGAEQMAINLDISVEITSFLASTVGGGIRGSIITTFYLIGLTLVIALPLGVGGAIYLHEFSSRNNKITNTLRNMIDMLSGVPSIVFGLVGAVVFIPFTSTIINAEGGNLLSGALTLSIILLPIIIKTTEEALLTIPKDYRTASLALGANKTDTIFKVILPNAIPGLLTATILSIGRIIGESAALIYAVGTAIKDQVIINEKSTSLAVHIWSLMSGETPNLELACTISIIILIVVFILSMSVKLVSKKINKFA